MDISGKIKVIGETQVISEKFKKRELVITTEDKYPQHITLQLVQDKCNILDRFKVGK